MIIDGLDIANSTGLCRLDRPGSISKALVHVINVGGDDGGDNAEDKAGLLALELRNRYGPRGIGKPDFVAIEMPMRNVVMYKKQGKPDLAGKAPKTTINPNALQLSSLAGAAVAIIDAFGIPWGLVSSATWRSVYYGKGFVPPVKTIHHRNGTVSHEDDWKQAAITEARRQGVTLPGDKIAQGDAAEALAVAVCWEKCTFIPERHRKAFMALRTGQARAA